jgi:hypothetical protein
MNDADLRHSEGEPKEEVVAVIDQVFQSWAEETEALPAAPDLGPPATTEDKLLPPARLTRSNPPNPHLGSDYVRELQAEFEKQEEGGKLR